MAPLHESQGKAAPRLFPDCFEGRRMASFTRELSTAVGGRLIGQPAPGSRHYLGSPHAPAREILRLDGTLLNCPNLKPHSIASPLACLIFLVGLLGKRSGG